MSFLKKLAIVLAALVIGIVLLVGAGLIWWRADAGVARFPDYTLDLVLRSSPGAANFAAGAAKRDITPHVPDHWVDVNGNGEFDEGTDSWSDGNGNHRFDKVWMAGYGKNRPAAGVHDTLWARAVVFGYPGCRMALCALDLVGLFHDDVIDIRQRVEKELTGSPDQIDHVIVASTHVHAGPDVLGIWGKDETESGVAPAYLEQVRAVAAQTIIDASHSSEPADVSLTSGRTGVEGFMRDSREPIVMDDELCLARFVRRGTDRTIATVANWGNHPEVMDDKNLIITSDFPHYVRQGIESGLPASNTGKPSRPGVGGVCVYVSGAVGGLMTPLGVGVPERFGPDTTYRRGSFEKARALGYAVADLALDLLDRVSACEDVPEIALGARTITIPLENKLYRAGAKLGVIDRGFVDGRVRTEVDVLRFGTSSWAFIPGEIYPEIVIGGVERPDGADIPVDPVETPPIKSFMPSGGGPQFVVGLANDEIGYIIPRSQWDVEPPYAYGRSRRPYGEINSVGPEAGPLIYRTVRDLWSRLADQLARRE